MTRCVILLLAASLLPAQTGWWMREPIRWVQTNLRETDAALDTQRLVEQLAGMRANVVLMGMGGIAAYYPTTVAFHYPSPYLPPGRDMFGDVLAGGARARDPRGRPLSTSARRRRPSTTRIRSGSSGKADGSR